MPMPPMSIRPTRLHLGNLSIKVSSDDIERFFHGYGRIVQIVLKRGYAFVELDNEKDADDAVRDLHGRQMDGMTVNVQYALLSPKLYNYRTEGSRSPISHHHHSRDRSPTPQPPARACSPRAAEWYNGLKESKKAYANLYGKKLNDKNRRKSRSPRRKKSRQNTRSASPHDSHSHRHIPSHTSTSTIIAAKRENLPNLDLDDAKDEYEEEEDEPFFKLLDHRSELESMAKQLSLDINIRQFDGSVAFGGTLAKKRPNIKEEPSTSSSSQKIAEKWMVVSDKGPTLILSIYERNNIVKEYTIPKFDQMGALFWCNKRNVRKISVDGMN